MTHRDVEILRRLQRTRGRCSTSYAGGRPASCAATYRSLRRLEAAGFVTREQTSHWPYWSISPKGSEWLGDQSENAA